MKTFRLGALALLIIGTATVAQATSDVGPYYWVFKRRDFVQTSTANPVPAGAPFHLNSLVMRAAGGSFTGGTSFITPPGSGVVNLPQPYSVISDGSLNYDAYLSSQTNLDNAFGSGGYILDIVGSHAQQTATVSLIGPSSFPPEIPKISNTPFSNAELVVHPTAAFTLNWNSFASHDFVDDVIILTITNGTTIVLREVLPATQTSRPFPANFFHAEQTYTVEINFVKVVGNGAGVSGSVGLAGFVSSTRIVISTSSRVPISGVANLSTRGMVGTGDNVLISGFVITSTDSAPMRVVLRAIGPTLAASHIAHPLADPVLSLFDAQNPPHLIQSNDNWRNTPSAGLITAAGLNPRNDLESAIIRDLPPGPYTAVVSGKNNATGTGLTEVYNLGSNGQTKLINISTRGQVLTNDDVMICGLVVQGAINHSYLLRALGPSLTRFGVTGVLANPTLQLVDAQGSNLAFNDNWRASQQAEIQATGLAPTDDRESAMLETLGPGTYTAIVRGKSGATGVGLVETYARD